MFYDTATPHSNLQTRLLERMRLKQHSLAQVAKIAGVKVTTIWQWFNHPERALLEDSLRGIAAYMEIDYSQALVEAGGKTGRDIWSEKGRENKKHLPLGKKNLAKRREYGAKGGATLRERYRSGKLVMSQDHIEKVRASKKANPDGWKGNIEKDTLRGKAQSLVGGFRRQGLIPEKARAEAARRLLGPPYNVRTEEEALALVASRKKSRKIDWYAVIELRALDRARTWSDITKLLSMEDEHNVRTGFDFFLTR